MDGNLTKGQSNLNPASQNPPASILPVNLPQATASPNQHSMTPNTNQTSDLTRSYLEVVWKIVLQFWWVDLNLRWPPSKLFSFFFLVYVSEQHVVLSCPEPIIISKASRMFDRFILVQFSKNFKINVEKFGKKSKLHSLCVNKSSQYKSDRKSGLFLCHRDARVADLTHLRAKTRWFRWFCTIFL